MNKRVDSKQLVLSIDADENLEESLGIISCESSQESIGMRNPKMRIGAVSHSERNGRIYPKVFRNSIAPAKKRQNKTQKKKPHTPSKEKKKEKPPPTRKTFAAKPIIPRGIFRVKGEWKLCRPPLGTVPFHNIGDRTNVFHRFINYFGEPIHQSQRS